MKIKKNISLAPKTTLRVGGKASFYSLVGSKDELIDVIAFAKEKNLPINVLGEGSNVLVSDKGVRAVVIKLINKKVKVIKENSDLVIISVEAGKKWDEFVSEIVKANYQGIECLSGIPGTVGAAPVQNIGAYGQELKNVFIKLLAYDLVKNKFVDLYKKDCKFGYRDSVFKSGKSRGRYIIFELTLRLIKQANPFVKYNTLSEFLRERGIESPTLQEVRKAVIALRKQRLEDPKKVSNAGSFFKNPIISKGKFNKLKKRYPDMPYYQMNKDRVKVFAAWLIEKAGWKGRAYKNVAVSKKHALIITNPNNKASAKEIRDLVAKIVSDVQSMFGLKLISEVELLGF